MSGLVHELQQATLDDKSSVSSLLRKALLVATKLGVSDLEAWARSELQGDGVPIPEYRKIRGAPKVRNPEPQFVVFIRGRPSDAPLRYRWRSGLLLYIPHVSAG
jgi:hypothetical protein